MGLANQEGSQDVSGEGRQLDAFGALNSSGAWSINFKENKW